MSLETKFKVGDNVRILEHYNPKHIGKIGMIRKIIYLFDTEEERDKYAEAWGNEDCEKNETLLTSIRNNEKPYTTAMYYIKYKKCNIPGAASDNAIELVK